MKTYDSPLADVFCIFVVYVVYVIDDSHRMSSFCMQRSASSNHTIYWKLYNDDEDNMMLSSHEKDFHIINCLRYQFYIRCKNITALKNKQPSIWQLCHHWWHRKLSLRQLKAPQITKKLSNWRPLVFSACSNSSELAWRESTIHLWISIFWSFLRC